jgi:hypothetical protein
MREYYFIPRARVNDAASPFARDIPRHRAALGEGRDAPLIATPSHRCRLHATGRSPGKILSDGEPR